MPQASPQGARSESTTAPGSSPISGGTGACGAAARTRLTARVMNGAIWPTALEAGGAGQMFFGGVSKEVTAAFYAEVRASEPEAHHIIIADQGGAPDRAHPAGRTAAQSVSLRSAPSAPRAMSYCLLE